MFERYYVKPATVDRIVANWLAPQIERYVEWMDSQGYATRNVYRRVPILCQFGEFAKQKGITEVSAAAALGLRVGEVSRLKLRDVDCSRDTLFIRDTKFSKSRLVPLGPKLARRVRNYIAERYGNAADAETPLFSFTTRGCISEGTISQTFHKLVPLLGLEVPSGASQPRTHDLRHSFAVGTLLRWYREGTDPNSRLIRLAAFLGHVDPCSTAVYLTITEELLLEAGVDINVIRAWLGHAWTSLST